MKKNQKPNGHADAGLRRKKDVRKASVMPGAAVRGEKKFDSGFSFAGLGGKRLAGLTAAILLSAVLAAAIMPAIPNEGERAETPLTTPTPQLSKEYIYAGSRTLAIEDYGVTSISPTPTPTSTP